MFRRPMQRNYSGQRIVVGLFVIYAVFLVLTACMTIPPGWYGARSVEGSTFWKGVFSGLCVGVLFFAICIYELHHAQSLPHI